MSRKDLDKIIRDYLSGKHTPEGEELFDAWYASHDDKTSPLDALSNAEKEKIRQEIFAKVKPAHPAQPQKVRKLQAPSGWKSPQRWYRIAAVWAGLLLLSLAWFVYTGHQDETTVIQTAYGEIKTVTLPDGSEVTLNANSTLRHAVAWRDHTNRQVWLDGEAFFSVVHTNDERKFQVHTQHLNVEVLGTEFNVNNRRGDTQVVLHSGKVRLAINDEEATSEVVMTPGELVAYSGTYRSITKKLVNPQRYSAWRDQELMLDNTSLTEIAQALEDYYGFEVVIPEDTLKNIKLTATTTLSLKETEVILTAISEIYGIEVKQEGDRIVFSNP
jgi:ferric-dicitrate binding protein FerR (iron transport regulator)